MTNFEIYDELTAAPEARDVLTAISRKAGFVPRIFGLYAASSVALNALASLNTAFSASSFTSREREIISIATSVENQCVYCVAGHSAFANRLGFSSDDLRAMREGSQLSDARENVLYGFTGTIAAQRADIPDGALEAFFAAGFTKAHVFELLVGMAEKTMTNFASKISRLEIDDEFSEFVWDPARATKDAA